MRRVEVLIVGGGPAGARGDRGAEMRRVEVLIVGGGPAGSAAAIRLARQGREVLLVERRRFPRAKACGEVYNPEARRLLRELGVEAALERAGARPVPEVAFVGGGARLALPFAAFAPEPALSLPRERLDALLLETARAAGAEVWEETVACEPLVEAGVVTGARLRPAGPPPEARSGQQEETRAVHARITLAADGLGSRMARRLGLAVESRRRRLGFAARYRAREGAAPRVEMHAGPDGCCGLVLRGGEAHVAMTVDARRAREFGGDPARAVDAALARWPDLRREVEGEPEQLFAIGALPWRTRRQAAAGCLLLGDAAGFYDPMTGQGVTFALLTAELAAEVAVAALQAGDCSAARLAEYARRRRALLLPRVRLQQAIQAALAHPRLLRRAMDRLGRRPELAGALLAAVADLLPPARLLAPALWLRWL